MDSSEDKNRRFDTLATGIILNRQNQGLTLDDVYVFGPSLLLNVRYGITYANFTERRISRGFDLASLGFGPSVVNAVPKSLAAFPRVTAGSLTELSANESGDGGNYSTTHNIAGTVTKLRGDHSFRMGADFRAYRENQGRFPDDLSPQLAFSSTYTRGPLDNSPAPQLGGELASLLLGVPDGAMTRTATLAEQDNYLGLFLHDDYKVSSKLTVNFGLRYELETPVTERYNRSVAGFASNQASPVEAAARANYAAGRLVPELPLAQFSAKGGLTFSGVNGNPRTSWKGERNNFMPRIGLAWQVAPQTVFRAGYGMFFDTLGVNKSDSIQTGFSLSTPIQASLDNGLTFAATTANPFPNGLLQPLGASGGLSTNLGQNVSFFPAKRLHAYTQRWSGGFQQVLPRQFLLEATYVASRGARLGVTRQLNTTPASFLSTSRARDPRTIDFLSEQFPNPFFGTNPIYGRNTSRGNLLRPFPQFGNVSFNDPAGFSWYHSLQSRIEKRFSKGYTIQVSYTFSKNMQATEFLNAVDPMPYRSISDLDRPHRLVTSGIWELPFGRGRKWGAGMPKPLEFFAGGWQLNGVVQKQSGPPLCFGDVWTLFTGNPDSVVLPKSQRRVDRWFNTDAGFNKNNAQQLASNLRVSPLRLSGIRGDGQSRWDFSVIKSFRLAEKGVFQFRAECLNSWNHPNLSGPNTTPTNTAFGTITGQDVPRSWTFSLKFSY